MDGGTSGAILHCPADFRSWDDATVRRDRREAEGADVGGLEEPDWGGAASPWPQHLGRQALSSRGDGQGSILSFR